MSSEEVFNAYMINSLSEHMDLDHETAKAKVSCYFKGDCCSTYAKYLDMCSLTYNGPSFDLTGGYLDPK